MGKPFVPSAKQAAVFDWVRDGQGNATVIAVAGSGKSTTMVRALPHMRRGEPVLMLAFNAPVAKENKQKIRALSEETGQIFANVHAKTFHSLGFGALAFRMRMKQDQFDISDRKVIRMARAGWNEDDFKLYGKFCSALVGYAKGEGVGIEGMRPDTDEEWFSIVEHHGLELDSEEADVERAVKGARALLKRSNDLIGKGVIDYNDMLYAPLLWKVRLFGNAFVVVDEAQDTNAVRRELAARAIGPGGRLAAVGDPNQSIYGFTGANHDAMDLIRERFNCIELPLTTSYRCPRAIEPLAQRYVPAFEVHADAPEGEVVDMPERDALDALGPDDAVLCRQTAPLVGLAYRLINEGRACRVLGKEIGEGLVALMDKMDAHSVDGLYDKLLAYLDRETKKLREKDEEEKADALADKVTCLMIFIDGLAEGERTLRGLKGKIEAMFDDADRTGILTLCTAHKAKGKEWPTVAILEPELMPGRARKPWQVQQEDNLIYVAVTRAQERLIYIETEKSR